MRPPSECATLRDWLRRNVSAIVLKSQRSRRHTRGSHSQPLALPHIPPEIWGVIIQHACMSPHDPLDTSQELSFLETTHTQLPAHKALMAVKTNLSLVSKEWNALTRPFLFEFVWISRASQAKSLARLLLMEDIVDRANSSGRYIRRLHIETPVLERCAPVDLRSILDYSPQLCVYSDHQSVQRSLYNEATDPRCSPEAILTLVAQPKIRRLSWTSYNDAPFQLTMSPFLTNLTTRLEYLEFNSASPHFRTVFSDSLAGRRDQEKVQMNVHLPSLRSLKVSLDNNTFAVLASWDMPALANLSVLCSDFSYTDEGFSLFFQSHGAKLRQLELGHSSSLIEEHYLTTPSHLLTAQQQQPVPLAKWCPNLRELICSADAEWHWQSPDWIAPHILLPAHPRVELIGIRDIDTRLLLDMGVDNATPYFPLHEQIESLLRRDAFPNLRFVRDLSSASHEMRTVRPKARIMQFWMKVIQQCQAREVWLEDCAGVNITVRALQRAQMLSYEDAQPSS